jgi:hypothetical protein
MVRNRKFPKRKLEHLSRVTEKPQFSCWQISENQETADQN